VNTDYLAAATAGIPSLRAVFITAMPDCLLYSSWMRGDMDWAAEDVASYFGDLVRANREGLRSLNSWSAEMQVTIESSDALIVLQELSEDFVCCSVFERSAPLGMVRLNLRRMVESLKADLPSYDIEKRPRGVRVMEFLERYAPDPHAIVMRLALRTGISAEDLGQPDAMSAEQVEIVEHAAKQILGLKELAV